MMIDGLFEMDTPAPPDPTLSADRRRTQRQAQLITKGRHPLEIAADRPIMLHPDAPRTVHPTDPRGAIEGEIRCGSCVFSETYGHRSRAYPKCVNEARPASHGAATDVRAWWPGCDLWEARP